MENDYVLIGDKAKEKLIEGMNLIVNAIECTYGPNASNVCIKNPYNLKITKDGKTVAEAVKSKDPFVQAGIDLIREVSQKTADEVGDGSSTVAILTRAIVNNALKSEDPIETSKGFRKISESIIEYLKQNVKYITDREVLKKVATLSANNDEHIGEIIAEAYDTVGNDGIVTFEKSNEVNDRIEYSKGFKIDNGFFSPYLINTKEGNVELTNVQVYISDTKMEETKQVQEIWQKAIDEGKSLLLMAPDFDSSITMLIYRNMFKPNSTKQAGMVISPNFGHMRETSIKDIKSILGESMMCEKVVMTKDSTTFIGYTPSEEVKERIEDVKEIVKQNLSEIEKNFHLKRLANLTGGFATIYVGGYSETEIKTRCDLYEDAIAATKCALEGGILPGGGEALSNAAIKLDDAYYRLREALCTPYRILSTKCEILTDYIDTEKGFWLATNYKTGNCGNAITVGVIEPFLVVKATLENAVSAATNILTTNCLIVNEE